jgi:protein involved in polysaccharide export with SLBB domain
MMRQLLRHLFTVALAATLATGCASRGELDLEALLRDLGIDGSGTTATTGTGSPDRPVTGLPDIGGGASSAATGSSSAEITIQPDCIVQVSVEEDKSLDGNYPVNEIGAIELGYVGPVILYNKTEAAAETKITSVLSDRGFKSATVAVKILRASYDKVLVVGAVNNPGQVKIGAGEAMSLNDVLLRAGGLRTSVKGAKVKIVRKGLLTPFPTALEGEEYALETEEGKPNIPDVRVRNNDVVNVFSGKAGAVETGGEKQIIVLGEGVSRPGVYRFTDDETCTMMHLVFKLGKLPLYANKEKFKIVRTKDDGKQEEIIVNVEKIVADGKAEDDVPLENGDRVIVPASKFTLF